MSLIDHVTQDPATDPAILMRRLDLQFTYFDTPRLIQYLDHTHALSVGLDERDAAALPALAGVASMTWLIPTAEGRDEKLPVDTPP